MKRLIAALIAYLRRVEHAAVGDVEDILHPLRSMQNRLHAVQARSVIAAEKARTEADALLVHADSLAEKGVKAVEAAAKLDTLLGR